MEDCIFCKIIEGAVPSKVVYEDEVCKAFRDGAPQAPVHVLVVPKRHVESLAKAADDEALLGHLMRACALVAESLGLADGYRVVTNVGENGCQSVRHLHLHVLGGQRLSEKMS